MKNVGLTWFTEFNHCFWYFWIFSRSSWLGVSLLDEVLRPGLPSATHADESTDAERSAQRCWERKPWEKTMLIDLFIGVERGWSIISGLTWWNQFIHETYGDRIETMMVGSWGQVILFNTLGIIIIHVHQGPLIYVSPICDQYLAPLFEKPKKSSII